jgi:very-short-patch-repair endonuclease
VNPVVRHFLPSVVRGVYRADDEFAKIEDERAFKRFVEAKLRFLPPTVAEAFRRQLSLDDDFERTQQQQTLPGDLIEPVQTTAQRANAFFRRHAYFNNALGTKAEIEQADNYLEIQFVRKVLAPLMSDAGLRVVQAQRSIGPYQVDFALEGASKFAIEVDGFGKFKERRNLDDFHKRQNYIMGQGWRIVRFTFSQIMENTAVTLKFLHTLFKGDAKLRGFLTVQ